MNGSWLFADNRHPHPRPASPSTTKGGALAEREPLSVYLASGISALCLPSAGGLSGPPAWLPGCPVVRLPGCPVARLPGCPVARLPGCPVARLPGCPGCPVAWLAWLPGWPGCPVACLPGCLVTWSPRRLRGSTHRLRELFLILVVIVRRVLIIVVIILITLIIVDNNTARRPRRLRGSLPGRWVDRLTYIYIYIYIYIYTYIYIYRERERKNMYIYTHICMYVYVCIYIYICTHTCMYIYIYIYTHIWYNMILYHITLYHIISNSVYIYIYIYVYVQARPTAVGSHRWSLSFKVRVSNPRTVALSQPRMVKCPSKVQSPRWQGHPAPRKYYDPASCDPKRVRAMPNPLRKRRVSEWSVNRGGSHSGSSHPKGSTLARLEAQGLAFSDGIDPSRLDSNESFVRRDSSHPKKRLLESSCINAMGPIRKDSGC